MVQLIVGKKGKGKTKQLLDKVNAEVKTANGNIVYIDKSTKHMFELKHRRDCTFVLHGVKIDVALVVALDALCGLLGAGHAVRAVVVRKNDETVLIEIICKIIVSACVFRHTVRDLHNGFGISHVVPKIALQYRSVETFELFSLHIKLPIIARNERFFHNNDIITLFFANFKT